MLPADGRCLASWPIEQAASRQPTRASSTDNGSAPPAYVAPAAMDSATAPAGAIDVIDWNMTSRRPMAPCSSLELSLPAACEPAMTGLLLPFLSVIDRDLGYCKSDPLLQPSCKDRQAPSEERTAPGAEEAAMDQTSAIDEFLTAVETATIADCDAWNADAVLDATVPNWRLRAAGADAIRA